MKYAFLILVALGILFSYSYKVERIYSIDYTDEPGIKFIIKGKNHFEFEYRLNIQVEERLINNEIYHFLSIKNEGHIGEVGKPELPVVTKYIAIPLDGDIKVEVLKGDSVFIPNIKPWPYQVPLPDYEEENAPFKVDKSLYKRGGTFPDIVYSLSPSFVIRGTKVKILALYPVKFWNGGIIVYPELRVKVDLFGSKFVEERKRSIFYEPLFSNLLLNYFSLGIPQKKRIGEGADLLIITPDEFSDELEELAKWKTKEGIKAKIVKLQDIGPSPTADDIANFIENAYATWELPPSFVMLVGDADMVPVHYRTIHPYHGTYIGTDLYYGTVDGSDYFPDIFVGRISIEDSTELFTVISKILTYEKCPPMSPNWFDDLLLAAYNESGRYFIATSESIYVFLDSLGYSVNRQYQGGNPPGSTQGVLNAINGGIIIANHRDHGTSQNDNSSYTGWAYPQFTTSHVAGLTNGDMLPLFFSINCESNWFDGETDENTAVNYESLGEVILRKSNGGGIALIGATRVSYSGYNDELDKGFFDALWPDFDGYYPDTSSVNPYAGPLYYMGGVLDYAKFWMYDKYVSTGGSGYPWPPNPQITKTEFEEFALIGDPTLYTRTSYPSSAIVDHPPNIPIGMSVFTVTVKDENLNPVRGALVALTQGDSLLARAVTDEMGTASIEILIVSSDTVKVTVTGYNLLPYEGFTVPFTSGAFVYIVDFAIDDDSSGLSYGNGDSIPSPGETMEITVTVKNWGNDTANGVYGIIESADPYITLIDSELTFGNIPPGDSSVSSDPFVVSISPSTPLNHTVSLTLHIESSSGDSWTSPINFIVKKALLRFYAYYVVDTLGNGNGMLDPGEDAGINILITNDGSATGEGFICELQTEDPYISVLNGSVSIPTISTNDTISLSNFLIHISDTVPSPYVAEMTLRFTSIFGVEEFDTFQIVIGTTGLAEDFEEGSGDWTHLSLTPSYIDQWHIETFRTHSGDSSYKCGGAGSLNYSNFVDAALVSPQFVLGPFSRLYFWHWMDAETSSYYQGYAYDGGIVELKVNGEWIQITPEEGYPFLQRGGSGSPFEEGTPIFSGYHDWKREEFDLFPYIGEVQLRFRFGTDQGVTREGWYIDDIWVGTVVEIEEKPKLFALTGKLMSFKVYPNPSQDCFKISFVTSSRTRVILSIYNIAGRVVKIKELGTMNAGYHEISIPPTDGVGRKLSSGVYFIEIKAGTARKIKKAILLQN